MSTKLLYYKKNFDTEGIIIKKKVNSFFLTQKFLYVTQIANEFQGTLKMSACELEATLVFKKVDLPDGINQSHIIAQSFDSWQVFFSFGKKPIGRSLFVALFHQRETCM